MSYFPMFIDLKDCPCLVVGGGSVALRKVAALEDFGAKVTVIAPAISGEFKAKGSAVCLEKEFEESDIASWALVVAATNDARLNRRISKACHEKGIPVNAVDQIEDCSFIFPAYLKEGEVVAAFSSGGQSPSIAQYLKSYAAPAMTPLLGETAACLGQIRSRVKQCTATEQERKRIYQAILEFSLEEGRIPTEREIWELIGQSLTH